MTTRRSFLRTAAGLLVAAPAIVRAESIMPVFVRRPALRKLELMHIERFRVIESPCTSFFDGLQWTPAELAALRPHAKPMTINPIWVR